MQIEIFATGVLEGPVHVITASANYLFCVIWMQKCLFKCLNTSIIISSELAAQLYFDSCIIIREQLKFCELTRFN